jgi:hypothetical protein
MERLTSCYFCGAGVDSQIREYPVLRGRAPDGLDVPPPDERPTVSLCPTCRRKLDHLLEVGLEPETANRAKEDERRVRATDPSSASTAVGDSTVDTGASIPQDAEIFGEADPIPVTDDEDGEEGTVSEDEDGDGGHDESDTDEGVPREAYDKVVRLLQNREFPVDAGDILAVATNAYGLRRRDCEAAIDRLVEQGVIGREGDRLVRED